jgi:hypothetical protein
MDKRIVGVVGAISGLAAADNAQAAVVSPSAMLLPPATSFAELLDSIPNAVALLQSIEAREAALGTSMSDEADSQVTLVGYHHHHRRYHHHHHHHHRVYHHHHHHHRWRHHHHHHHHHHRSY